MTTPAMQPPPENSDEYKLKIYFLPNLLTAGNLFCGFVALTKIVQADAEAANYFQQIKLALFFILLACIFDLFDGRIARMGGAESPFGREFDSLADLISFGVAPAFLVHRIVLGTGSATIPGRLVHRLDLSDLRRVPVGALQRARRAAERERGKGIHRFPDSVGGGTGGVADSVHDVVGRKRFQSRLPALSVAVLAAVPVVDDGQRGEISELQIAGFTGDADVHQDVDRRAVHRRRADSSGETALLGVAGVLHGIPDLRFRAPPHFEAAPPRNRGGRRRGIGNAGSDYACLACRPSSSRP